MGQPVTMTGFTKLFGSIVHSTIWREPNHVRLVWITMLALADSEGRVEASVPGLADAARVSIEECEEALTRLGDPDKYSRSKDFEGRRIEPMDGGWLLLNYLKYRAVRDAETRREQNRLAQQRCRSRKTAVSNCQQRQQRQPGSAHTEAEAEAEADTDRERERESARADSDRGQPTTTDLLRDDHKRRVVAQTCMPPAMGEGYGKHLRAASRWCDEKAELDGVPANEVVSRLLDGFFASTNPKVLGDWGMRFLGTDPSEFYPGAKPAQPVDPSWRPRPKVVHDLTPQPRRRGNA